MTSYYSAASATGRPEATSTNAVMLMLQTAEPVSLACSSSGSMAGSGQASPATRQWRPPPGSRRRSSPRNARPAACTTACAPSSRRTTESVHTSNGGRHQRFRPSQIGRQKAPHWSAPLAACTTACAPSFGAQLNVLAHNPKIIKPATGARKHGPFHRGAQLRGQRSVQGNS